MILSFFSGKTRESIEMLKKASYYNHIQSSLLMANLEPEGSIMWEHYMRIEGSNGHPLAQLALGIHYDKYGEKSKAAVW